MQIKCLIHELSRRQWLSPLRHPLMKFCHNALQDGPALGGLNSSTWRPGPPGGSATKIHSRFDTSSGPQRWKDDGSNGMPPRRDASDRWTSGDMGWGDTSQTGGRLYAEPQAQRWGADPAAAGGRGRPRGLESDWKPRADNAEWRAPSADPATRTEWRNDRWSNGQTSRTNDSWRGGSGVPGAAPMPTSAFARAHSGSLGPQGAFQRVDSFTTGVGAGGAIATAQRSPSSQFFRSFGAGGGVGGSMAWGPSKAQRRYTTELLARVYKQLLYSGQLRLPASVERDDPLLFLSEGDFADVVEQLLGVDRAMAGEAYLEHQASLMKNAPSRLLSTPGPQAFDGHGSQGASAGSLPPSPQQPPLHLQQPQQQYVGSPGPGGMPPGQGMEPGWVYRDPQGIVQGPFPKEDIMEWFDGGFFPLDLQLRSVLDPPDAPFHRLGDLLPRWRAPTLPPGFPPAGGLAPAPAPAPAPVPSMPSLPDDLLSGPMQQLTFRLDEPQQTAGPTPLSDPIVDPSIVVKRTPSSSLLHQTQQPFLMAPAPELQQYTAPPQPQPQPYMPLQAGMPLAPGPVQPQAAPRPAPWSAPQPQPQEQAQQAQQAQHDATSLLAIQQEELRLAEERKAAEEEARRAAAEEEERRMQQEGLMEGAFTPPPPPPPPPAAAPAPEPQRARPETKPAPWVAAAAVPETGSKSLLQIQQEEAERAAKEAERQAAAAAAAGVGKPSLGGAGWAKVARGPGASSGPSLLEIQLEEEKAKASAPVQYAEAEADEDEGLFWDYGKGGDGGAAPPPPPPPPRAPTIMPLPSPPAKKGGWAAAAAARTGPSVVTVPRAGNGVATAVRKPVSAPAPTAASMVRPPPPPPTAAAAQSSAAAFLPEDDSGEGSVLTGAFRMWCAEQMQQLMGSRDVTLCEFLMTLESNFEVAEYVATYMGETPAAATFSSEFLKRKLAEQASSSGKKSRKARAKANAAAAAAAAADSSKAAAAEASDSSWVSAAPAAGKKAAKKKGQKLDTALLAFGTGTNYSLLDVPE